MRRSTFFHLPTYPLSQLLKFGINNCLLMVEDQEKSYKRVVHDPSARPQTGEMEPDEVWKAPGPFSLSGLAIRAGNPHFAAEW